MEKLINSNYIFWPRTLRGKDFILCASFIQSAVVRSEWGKFWFRLYRKRNYYEEDDDPHPVCESQRLRSSLPLPVFLSPRECSWLTGSTLGVRGGMFNGNKIALKSLTGGDLDRNVRYWQLGAGIWSQGIWHPGSPRPGHWPPHKYCKQISRKKSVKKPMATEQHRGRSNQFITQYLMKIFKTDQTWV